VPPREAVQFLLEAGVLRNDEVVGYGVEVRNVSRRNNGLKVACPSGPSFYVKEGIGQERQRTVAAEARVLVDLLSGSARQPATASSFLPQFVAFDPDRCVLVTRLVPNGQSLVDLRPRYRLFSEGVARAIGASLGQFHCLADDAEANRRADAPDFVPFPFIAVEPQLTMLLSLSSGNVELVRVVQNTDEFLSLLHAVRLSWNVDHLIHGDMRMDNCVLSRRGRRSVVTIVDWELAGRGDPAWDIGTVIAEFIGAWLLSVPIVQDTTAQEVFRCSQFPFITIQRAIGAFIRAYYHACRTKRWTRSIGPARIARFAALRLIQIAFEQLQSASELTGQAVYLLQLSLNLLQKPDTATMAFLGWAQSEE